MSYRLPRDIQKRMDDTNEMLKARQRELDEEAKQPTAEEAERRAQAAEYMKDYHRRLAAKKAAEQAQRDAEFEASVAPVKRVKMLEWLIANPDKSEKDFARVWPHMRELLKIDDRGELIRREVEAQRGRRY